MALDIATLQAALVGYQAKHDELTAKMADIRKRISSAKHGGDEPFPLGKHSQLPRKKRKMSAAGRKAISDATKKRWAAFHKAKKAEL
jgi:hypothetical protein